MQIELEREKLKLPVSQAKGVMLDWRRKTTLPGPEGVKKGEESRKLRDMAASPHRFMNEGCQCIPSATSSPPGMTGSVNRDRSHDIAAASRRGCHGLQPLINGSPTEEEE